MKRLVSNLAGERLTKLPDLVTVGAPVRVVKPYDFGLKGEVRLDEQGGLLE